MDQRETNKQRMSYEQVQKIIDEQVARIEETKGETDHDSPEKETNSLSDSSPYTHCKKSCFKEFLEHLFKTRKPIL
jgi:hypothetical protein